MTVVTIFLYQDGTVRLMTPFVAGHVPEKFSNMLKAMPNFHLVKQVFSDGIVRWKLPVGYPSLACILTSLTDNGWKFVSSIGASPLHPGDVISIYSILYEGELFESDELEKLELAKKNGEGPFAGMADDAPVSISKDRSGKRKKHAEN